MPRKSVENQNTPSPREKATGKYVYDKKLKQVVKVSDDIPGLHKASSDGEQGSCCPHGGCCGHGACGHG